VRKWLRRWQRRRRGDTSLKLVRENYPGLPAEALVCISVILDNMMGQYKDELPSLCPATLMTEVPVDPEASKRILEQMLLEADVQILFGTIVTGVIKERNTVRGIIIENKNGQQVIEGKIFIDATGDGDLSVYAGAECRTGNDEEQPEDLRRNKPVRVWTL